MNHLFFLSLPSHSSASLSATTLHICDFALMIKKISFLTRFAYGPRLAAVVQHMWYYADYALEFVASFAVCEQTTWNMWLWLCSIDNASRVALSSPFIDSIGAIYIDKHTVSQRCVESSIYKSKATSTYAPHGLRLWNLILMIVNHSLSINQKWKTSLIHHRMDRMWC